MSGSAGRLTVFAAVLLVVAAGGAAAFQPPTQLDVDADSVSLRADVQTDGDADWTVTYRIRLDDENATQAFEELRADIQSDPGPYLDPFRGRMERTAAGAENATGREMAIRNVTVETRRESQPQVEFGVVTYRLEWTNFAAVEDGTVRAGDAVDQLFLDSRTTLRITAPEGYVVDSATPAPTRAEAGEAVWQGRRDFDPGEPRVVFVNETPAGTTPDGSGGGADGGTDGDTPTTTESPGETPAPGGGLPIVGLVAVVLVAVLAGAWIVTRRDGLGVPTGGDMEEGSEASAADDGPPPELLSNEERVLQLLEENGGRMKQKEVAQRLDWTAAKTSQVVGDLRDDGELEAFRLGRENVLTLPDVDIDAGEADDTGEE